MDLALCKEENCCPQITLLYEIPMDTLTLRFPFVETLQIKNRHKFLHASLICFFFFSFHKIRHHSAHIQYNLVLL